MSKDYYSTLGIDRNSSEEQIKKAYKKLAEICKKIDIVDTEDIVITKYLRKHNYKLPSIEDCHHFAMESLGYQDRVVGIHGTDKYYILPEIMHNF